MAFSGWLIFFAGNVINTAKHFPFRNGMRSDSVWFWSINLGLFARHKQSSSRLMPGTCNLRWIVHAKQPGNEGWIQRSGPSAGVASSLGSWYKTVMYTAHSHPSPQGSGTRLNRKRVSIHSDTSSIPVIGRRMGKSFCLERTDPARRHSGTGTQSNVQRPRRTNAIRPFPAYELSNIPVSNIN